MNMLGQDAANEPRFAGAHSPDAETERAARQIRARVMAEIDRLSLRKYLGDLEIDGYAILPPEVVGPLPFAEQLRDRALEVLETDTAERIDIRPDRINEAAGMFGQTKNAFGMLRHGRIFEQALMNEPMLAIMSYLLGESCRLQSMMAVKKGPGRDYMPLHADNNHTGTPAPFPVLPEHANATWILTDYNEENGSSCFVDGSHRLHRQPTSAESRDITLFKPIEAKAGSILIFAGSVWHGSVPRRVPGYRVSLIMTFARWYGWMYEQIYTYLPPEAFERNPPRFGVLTGKPIGGYGSEDNKLRVLSQFG
jgi:hypothetical protein